MAEGAAAQTPTFKLVLVGDGGTGKVSSHPAFLFGLDLVGQPICLPAVPTFSTLRPNPSFAQARATYPISFCDGDDDDSN